MNDAIRKADVLIEALNYIRTFRGRLTVIKLGGRAVGLPFGSLRCLGGERLRLPTPEGDGIDLGRVGFVTRVEKDLILDLCAAGVVPVLPSLAVDADGGWLNVNADTAAAAVAAHLHAEKLVLLTDTPGILQDRRYSNSLLSSLDARRCLELVKTGVIDEGMIPKVEA